MLRLYDFIMETYYISVKLANMTVSFFVRLLKSNSIITNKLMMTPYFLTRQHQK